jgi:hypothetical protein
MTEKQLIKQAEKMVETIELRFGEGTIKGEQVNLTRLREWSWRISGARQLMRVLPLYMFRAKEKDREIYNKATIELIMSSPINMDRFLNQEYQIRYTEHQRDKKGKLIGCKAVFVEKVITYKNIE